MRAAHRMAAVVAGLGLSLGAALALGGCGTIGSAGGGSAQRAGDVWYVRNSTFFGLPMGGGSVWYCATPPEGTARTTCTEATIDEGDVGGGATEGAVATTGVAPATESAGGNLSTPSACGSLPLGATPTVTDEVTIRTPDAPAGGTVADGVYALARYEWHLPSAPHTRRTLLRVQGGRFDLAFVRDNEPERVLSGRVAFMPTGRVVFTVDCPNDLPLEFVGYTATPTGLVLYSRTPAKTATFTRQ